MTWGQNPPAMLPSISGPLCYAGRSLSQRSSCRWPLQRGLSRSQARQGHSAFCSCCAYKRAALLQTWPISSGLFFPPTQRANSAHCPPTLSPTEAWSLVGRSAGRQAIPPNIGIWGPQRPLPDPSRTPGLGAQELRVWKQLKPMAPVPRGSGEQQGTSLHTPATRRGSQGSPSLPHTQGPGQSTPPAT